MVKRGPFALARWREEGWRRRVRLELSGAYLSGLRLPGADLAHDNLASADLTGSDLRRADLAGASLPAAWLSRSDLTWANLKEAALPGAALNRAVLAGACLSGADLREADLSRANLSHSDLTRANLSGADLREADLTLADLSGARLNDARLTATTLRLANLSGADLRRAALIRTALDAAILLDAVLEMTLFADCDLSLALELESVQHKGPSIIGLDSLARSRGRIPEDFLRQCGVAEPLIACQRQALPQTVNQARVLLVGSIHDDAFARQLEQDLRKAGHFCWRLAVDDESIFDDDAGESLLSRFVYYDQPILVCSHASLGSPFGWRAFEQIARTGQRQPGGMAPPLAVALDDRIEDAEDALCRLLQKEPVVAFREWRQPLGYQEGFNRLSNLLAAPRGGFPLRPQPEPT